MAQLLNFAAYLAVVTSIFAMMSLSLNLQLGSCGLVNFGQVAFLLAGGYCTAIAASHGIGPWASIALAALVGGMVGVLLAFTVRNMSGTYWGILSLAMAEMLRLVMLNEQWIAGGAGGVSVRRTLGDFELVVLAATVLVYLLMRVIAASPFGRVIRLIREGDRLPQALGKNVFVFKIETMFIGGAVGGTAGAFYAYLDRYINPDDGLPVETFILWAMVILGGRGNPTGIILGTVVVQTLYVGTRYLTTIVPISPETLSALRLVVIGVLITLIMMFRPQGLLPEPKRVFR
ncbi:MAG: branched-chain amino acid ABC transporter permease [Alphaproteobacteria bacterium]|nr:branched-chain amino acid ABC transporter permease [Alphaproteobacteria bacterium]